MTPIAIAIATAGLLLVAGALVLRARERRAQLLELLEMPYAEETVEELDHLVDHTGLLEPGIGAVARMMDQLEVGDRVGHALESARILLRPGEFVLGVAAAAVAGSVWAAAMTGQLVFGVVALVAVPLLATALVRRRISKRRRAIEIELPTALSMMASSLEAGHTLARALDLMATETAGPLADEIHKALAETRLGAPLADALARMAERVQIEDLTWAVEAIRIQQTTGGRLSELLHTLAEYLLAREEIRRETDVLTAEGRASAWVLAALPFVVGLVIQLMNPDFIGQLFSFPGYLLAAYACVSVLIGLTMTLRMVKKVRL